jgi:hypothetical protein
VHIKCDTLNQCIFNAFGTSTALLDVAVKLHQPGSEFNRTAIRREPILLTTIR